jgi:4-aminobutyrate aminotransferase
MNIQLPGPKASALLERDRQVVAPVAARAYPFVMAKGRGAEVWDVDGNRFIDLAAGIAVTATGHAHPKVVEAIKAAADNFLHISCDFYHEAQIALAERLDHLAPFAEPAMTFFTNSGTEAIEGAVKLARVTSGRSRFIGFYGGFHGRSMGSLAFTASKYVQQQGVFPPMPGVTHIPYPNSYRPLFRAEDQGEAVLDYIENVVLRSNVPPDEVAAILVEPIQGEGGYLVPPDSFFPGLRDLCDRHGMLLIVDEIQSGIGRTGKMFAVEHFGVEPDIVCMAKGLASGMPVGAITARRSLMERWPYNAHGSTFSGNPLCCAAALATLDLVEGELMANAAHMGDYLLENLRGLQQKYPSIGQVRGKGLMIGLELVEDPVSKKPARELANQIVDRAFHNGLLTLPCGQSTVRLAPPLMIDTAIIEEAMVALDQTFAEVGA